MGKSGPNNRKTAQSPGAPRAWQRMLSGRRLDLLNPSPLDIEVEDAPFVAVELTSEGEGATRRLGFRLNTDDYVIAGPDNILRVETAPDGTPRPYIHVRAGLDALINRAVFYEMVELALNEGASPPGLWSEGCFFAFAPAPL